MTFAQTVDGPVEATTTANLVLPTVRRPHSWARRKLYRDDKMWMQFGDDRTWYVFAL